MYCAVKPLHGCGHAAFFPFLKPRHKTSVPIFGGREQSRFPSLVKFSANHRATSSAVAGIGAGQPGGHHAADVSPVTAAAVSGAALSPSAPDANETVDPEAPPEQASSLGPGTSVPKLPFLPSPLKPGLDLDVVATSTPALFAGAPPGTPAECRGGEADKFLGGVCGAGLAFRDAAQGAGGRLGARE